MQPIIEMAFSSCFSPVPWGGVGLYWGNREQRRGCNYYPQPICQLFKVALRKQNKDHSLSVEGGGNFWEQEVLEVEWGVGRKVDSKYFMKNGPKNALCPSTAPFYEHMQRREVSTKLSRAWKAEYNCFLLINSNNVRQVMLTWLEKIIGHHYRRDREGERERGGRGEGRRTSSRVGRPWSLLDSFYSWENKPQRKDRTCLRFWELLVTKLKLDLRSDQFHIPWKTAACEGNYSDSN